ncbi:low molecular weight protein-tyrosine-phosphatase [Salinisphaera japonica]|uniref:protein-tyrosine-phosphatase n=1 Tax=Salinisphaera japonica YTM-1 TaxID=1209778 RepID=A0A423PL82_9GAMM|nr:low molecular weight protein-tyrosine-phosphatase [Salinisphaera japonica]ROO26357.1 phosphotyrosine protein phosphatase [Salinisphaera japonica YTM-1]
MSFNNILCVCTGNICRSPLAEGLLRQALPHAAVSSAGISAVGGGTMPQEAQAIADREGLALAGHRGCQITSPIVNNADVILVMEKGQRDWIVERFPQARGRVFLLSHWSDGRDTADPFRRSQEFFETIFAEINSYTAQWAQRLGAPASA